jgi:L-amino acid N-acyltransferase YncA
MLNHSGRIRMATINDAPALAEIYRPYVSDTAVSFELVPPSDQEFAQRVARTLERTPWLVYERGGRIVGYAYASRHREREAYQWSVEVSAYVRTDAQRAGVARALYEKLFELLAMQGFYSAFAGITLPNDASVEFHQALGFKHIGDFHSIGYKFGRWHDTTWLERSIRAYDQPAGPPTPLSQIPCSLVIELLAR